MKMGSAFRAAHCGEERWCIVLEEVGAVLHGMGVGWGVWGWWGGCGCGWGVGCGMGVGCGVWGWSVVVAGSALYSSQCSICVSSVAASCDQFQGNSCWHLLYAHMPSVSSVAHINTCTCIACTH